MSERGLVLALQRFHDDPGFFDRVKEDPQATLGIYDLDEDQCDALIDAVVHNDSEEIVQLASAVGMDWRAPHVSGVGALPDEDTAVEAPTSTPRGLSGQGNTNTYNPAPASDSSGDLRPT